MIFGILAGIFWALETVILGIALSAAPFVSDGTALFLAPFISTFIHDMFSAVFMCGYNGIRGELREVFGTVRTKDFRYLVLASAIGGPVGMTGYVLAVNYMGSSVGAVASAVYPAIGSLLAHFFLKEKIRWYQWIFLLCTLLGVFALSYSPELAVTDIRLGLCGVFMCAFGWGTEGVILSKCFRGGELKSRHALQIRQTVSAAIYGLAIIPVIGGVPLTLRLFGKENVPVLLTIAGAAFFATVSYLCYYKAISKLGAAKAMGLNITYTAWAVLFSVIIFRDGSILNAGNVLCCIAVVVFGILSAVDLKELIK